MTDTSQRLATFLDRPGFPWKKLILGFSIGQFVLEGLLSLRQYQVLQNKKPPKTLEDEISQDVYDKSQVNWPSLYGRSAILTSYRHMAVQKQSLVSFLDYTPRYKTFSLFNTMSYLSCGH